MAQAKLGDKVKVHYTGRFEDGTVFDSSEGREPLEFTIGEGEVIPGFENAVIGMNPGDTKTETIPADQAYGEHSDDMIVTVDRDQIPLDMHPEVGQQLHLHNPSGQAIPVVVTDVSDTTITMDANHPLAGQDLIFDIEFVDFGSRLVTL